MDAPILWSADVYETPHLCGWPPLVAWFHEHDVDADDVYRAEILLIDGPVLRIYEYDRDANGHRYADGDDVARRRRDLLLRCEPPEYPVAC